MGTYVVFEYGHRELDAEEDDEEFEPPVDSAPVTFNLNFFRPHTFAFEAGEEQVVLARAKTGVPNNALLTDVAFATLGFTWQNARAIRNGGSPGYELLRLR